MENKHCSSCKKELPICKFYKSSTQSTGYQSNCIDCNRMVARDYYRNSVDKSTQKLKSREYLLKKKYGISLERYNKMFQEQKGKCAICKKKETQISNKKGGIDSLRVDHCHKTGKVKGLLCAKCSWAVGLFQDEMGLAMGMAIYLLPYKQEQTRLKQ